MNFDRRGERAVGCAVISGVHDQDAIAFLKRAGIKNNHLVFAFTDCVAQLKTAGLWTKIFAWYPILGGTSHSHSVNAKNPWQYQATYNGSPTHDHLGVEFTINTQYMDFGFASNALSAFSNCLSMYCTSTTATASGKADFGSRDSGTQHHVIFGYSGAGGVSGLQNYTQTGPSFATTTGRHMVHGNTLASNSRAVFTDGANKVTNASAILGTQPTGTAFRLGLVNGLTATLRRYVDVCVFNTSLSDAEVAAHYRIIHQLQTRLNRGI